MLHLGDGNDAVVVECEENEDASLVDQPGGCQVSELGAGHCIEVKTNVTQRIPVFFFSSFAI